MNRITQFRRRQTILSWVIGISTFLAVLLAGSAQATASATDYIGGNASTFSSGAGGWSNSSDYSGVCIPQTLGITCPAVSGSFEASGGFGGDGDGFIRSSENGTSLTSLLSSSSTTWTSPAFVYNGAGGGTTPDSLQFGLKVRSAMGALLALGADATYRVDAVNKSGADDVNLVDRTSIGPATGWESAPAVRLGKNALVIGDRYQFVIKTTVGGLAAVLPAGHVDYDNAVLTATGNPSGGGPGGGGPGGGPTGGGSGTEIAPPKVIPNGVAYLYRNRLFVRVRCPHRFKPTCHIKSSVKTRKKNGKQLSRRVRLSVKAHTFKRKSFKIKPKFRAKVKRLSKLKRRTVWLALKVKSKRGKKKGTVHHHLRVIHRVRK